MKRAILSISCALFAVVAFAGNPNGSKGENEVKAQQESFTYYVTNELMLNGELHYQVTTAPQAACGSGNNKPCQVTSSEEADANGRIPQDAVESIDSRRNSY